MIIQSRNVWYRNSFQPLQLELNGSRISRILPYGEKKSMLDYGDAFIIPGFIDVHTHGGYGCDCLQADSQGLQQWITKLPEEGVTGFLPTIAAAPQADILQAVQNIRSVSEARIRGAYVLGIHLEGPWLNQAYAGAQPPAFIRQPDTQELDQYIQASGNMIRLVTLAIENDTDSRFTEYCRSRNIIVSAGHSSASFEEVAEARKHGLQSVTHTFNRQSPLHHRHPGVTGAALRFHDMYAEIITDMHHVAEDAVNIFYTCKDQDHAVMITDSLLCKGMPAGTITDFAGQRIVLAEDGCAYLSGTDTLAGSTLRFDEGLRNVIEKAGVDPVRAIRSCTVNPAALLGLDDHLGLIEEDYDADLCITDQHFLVTDCYVKGNLLFHKS